LTQSLRTLAALSTLLLGAAGAGAAGPAPKAAGPRELAPTAAVTAQLRAAAVRYHRARGVRGPLLGSVRLARVGGSDWAIATFSVPRIGLAGQPELLRRTPAGPWRVLGTVGPRLCGVPKPVLRVWDLERRTAGCTSPLGGREPPPVAE
jgi:hypothetical protein